MELITWYLLMKMVNLFSSDKKGGRLGDMETDPTFELFHRYSKLVRRSVVRPLICQKCEGFLVTIQHPKTQNLALKCYACNSVIEPGSAMIDDVEAVVKEHFDY